MKKNTFFFIFIILLVPIKLFSQETKIVTYDPKILNIPYSSWIAPLIHYKTAIVQKQIDTFIRIDKGEIHGIKNGFIYEIKNSKNTSSCRIVITVIADTFSEGYLITPTEKVEEKSIAIFTGNIDLEENPSYAIFAEPEVKGTITLLEKDNLFYGTLPEKSFIAKGHHFIIKDENQADAGIAEALEIIPKGSTIFKIIKIDKNINVGFTLISKPRNLTAWKNLAIELSRNNDNLQNALYAFYKAYELDKTNPSIKEGFIDAAQRLAKKYEKDNIHFKALHVYRQCQTTFSDCKEEVKKSIAMVKNNAYILWEEKNLLLAIKNMEMLDQDEDIQSKLAISYNNLATSIPFEENPDYQIYLYQRALEIDSKNILIIKNLFNLYLSSKNYSRAAEHLKHIQKDITDEENKSWIEKNLEDISRLEKGIIRNYIFKTLNQNAFDLDSLKGKTILLLKWSMNDSNSLEAMDFLPAFFDQYKDKHFKLLAVNTDTRDRRYIDTLKNFMTKYGNYNFDVVYSEEDLKDLFRLKNYPESILLDKEAKIIYQESGMISDDLEKLINQLTKN